MTALRFVLGDQLTRSLSSLRGLDPARDIVLMVEVVAEATYVRHHKQKIAFLFSAMRHFAESLREEGIRVDYVRLDDPANSQSFTGSFAALSSATALPRFSSPSPANGASGR